MVENSLTFIKVLGLLNISRSCWRCRSWKNTSYDKVMLKIIRYVRGCLPKNAVPTIGIEFAGKPVTLPNNIKVKA